MPALLYRLLTCLALSLWLLSWQPATAAAQRLHTIKSGQTLSKIARRYRVGVWDLALANGLKPNSKLRVGQNLEVPPKGVTYVRAGQTLSHIARAHGCSVAELKRLNRIRRDGRLRLGSRLMLPGFVSEEDQVRDWGKPEQAGVLTIVRKDQRVQLALVDAQGRVLRSGLAELAKLMRRHEDDPLQPVHPRLALLLAKISDHFGGRTLTLVSGFREAGGYTRESSRHIAGRAADIRVDSVPRRVLWDYCRSLAGTGCGHYPRSVFVHVDVREDQGQWVDWSGPGKRPRYGTLRRPYRRRERRDPGRPRVTRRVTRPAELPMRVEVVDTGGRVVHVVDERPAEPTHAALLGGG
ncbi:MAG: LysM peptidoglycan-binding domain-containing protein [Myxococcales bacterium]|nr:LysM peptidoglycan-binding domain-containing protein [Myxococcales bacterium]